MSLFMHHIVKLLNDKDYKPNFTFNFKIKKYNYDFNEIFLMFD